MIAYIRSYDGIVDMPPPSPEDVLSPFLVCSNPPSAVSHVMQHRHQVLQNY